MSTYLVVSNSTFTCKTSASKPYLEIANKAYLQLTTDTNKTGRLSLTNSSIKYIVVEEETTTYTTTTSTQLTRWTATTNTISTINDRNITGEAVSVQRHMTSSTTRGGATQANHNTYWSHIPDLQELKTYSITFSAGTYTASFDWQWASAHPDNAFFAGNNNLTTRATLSVSEQSYSKLQEYLASQAILYSSEYTYSTWSLPNYKYTSQLLRTTSNITYRFLETTNTTSSGSSSESNSTYSNSQTYSGETVTTLTSTLN